MSKNPKQSTEHHDVVVVGARCAGASTAMLLARRGLRVLLLDRSARGSDTLSTHALMRGATLQLSRWGVLPALEETDTPAIARTTFHYGEETIPVDIPERNGIGALYAPRRARLDGLLVDAAVEAGVEARFGVRVEHLVFGRAGRVRGVEYVDRGGRTHRVHASLVIGADGRQSRVAREVGARELWRGRSSSAVIYGYFEDTGFDGYHWHYDRGVSAGVIPSDGGTVNLFAAFPSAGGEGVLGAGVEQAFHRVLASASPALAAWAAEARSLGKYRRFAGATGFLRECAGEGWALVGDASHFKDPMTAHGITDALRDAELLADAVAVGDDGALAHYANLRAELSRPMLELGDRMASFEWDLPELMEIHRALSREMKRECSLIEGFETPTNATYLRVMRRSA